MKVKEAIAIVGPLSEPEKMPGKAWGIPASHCHRGRKLAERVGTVCFGCYAGKGRYVMPKVRAAYERRYQKYMEYFLGGRWYDAMCHLIRSQCRKVPFFRWFDSGDLQDFDMLWNIVDVCSALPEVHFWLSTRERGIVRKFLDSWVKLQPANLVIRVSADLLGQRGPAGFPHTSGVMEATKQRWEDMVLSSTDETWYCPAPLQDNHCGDCRACWDPQVKHVIYRRH